MKLFLKEKTKFSNRHPKLAIEALVMMVKVKFVQFKLKLMWCDVMLCDTLRCELIIYNLWGVNI